MVVGTGDDGLGQGHGRECKSACQLWDARVEGIRQSGSQDRVQTWQPAEGLPTSTHNDNKRRAGLEKGAGKNQV